MNVATITMWAGMVAFFPDSPYSLLKWGGILVVALQAFSLAFGAEGAP